MISPG